MPKPMVACPAMCSSIRSPQMLVSRESTAFPFRVVPFRSFLTPNITCVCRPSKEWCFLEGDGSCTFPCFHRFHIGCMDICLRSLRVLFARLGWTYARIQSVKLQCACAVSHFTNSHNVLLFPCGCVSPMEINSMQKADSCPVIEPAFRLQKSSNKSISLDCKQSKVFC